MFILLPFFSFYVNFFIYNITTLIVLDFNSKVDKNSLNISGHNYKSPNNYGGVKFLKY